MTKRLSWILLGLVMGLVMGGVAYAVVINPPSGNDRYYACVSNVGIVKAGTVRLNAPPTRCPNASDEVHSWNAVGSTGPTGATGLQGPTGPTAPAPVTTINAVHLVPEAVTYYGPTDNGPAFTYDPTGCDSVRFVANVDWAGAGSPSTSPSSYSTGYPTLAALANRTDVSVVPILSGQWSLGGPDYGIHKYVVTESFDMQHGAVGPITLRFGATQPGYNPDRLTLAWSVVDLVARCSSTS